MAVEILDTAFSGESSLSTVGLYGAVAIKLFLTIFMSL
jgi:hypothetical protein